VERDLLISQPQAARLLGVSTDTVRRAVADGVLSPIYLRPNGHPRLRRVDVERLLAEQVSNPPQILAE